MFQRPLTSTLFPYTTLFRSRVQRERQGADPQLSLSGGPRELGVARRHDGHLVALGGEQRDDAADHRRERSEEHTSELQSQFHLVCRLLLEKKKKSKVQRREG